MRLSPVCLQLLIGFPNERGMFKKYRISQRVSVKGKK